MVLNCSSVRTSGMADNETPPPIVVLSFDKLFSSTFFSPTVNYSFTLHK